MLSDKSSLEYRVGTLLADRRQTVAVAESCTGGLVMHRLTNVPGSSAYFPGGAVTYSYEAKQQILGVQPETLAAYGAVSSQTALEMARGVRLTFGADYGIGVTGIAGPAGGTETKPIGLVYIALSSVNAGQVIERRWQSDREGNKQLSADAALQLLFDWLTRL
ncbi:MAG: CinA family protein [Aggregatilineales bacterium]